MGKKNYSDASVIDEVRGGVSQMAPVMAPGMGLVMNTLLFLGIFHNMCPQRHFAYMHDK